MKIRILLACLGILSCTPNSEKELTRERISINEGWKFFKYESTGEADDLIYDVRPEEDADYRDSKDADTQPTEAIDVESGDKVLKPWILPTGNAFIMDPAKKFDRPKGDPGADFPFVQLDFDDSDWVIVTLPHDWGIEGPFLEGWDAEVGGGMGRLASHGVAWYRRILDIPATDLGKKIFLDIDGAMSYAMVWINGKLAGGWPYGYNSFRVDLTPFLEIGGANQLAIRIDNPPKSSRWYPGGGIYRNVWLVKTNPVHIAQWGTYVTTLEVSAQSASVQVEVSVDNTAESEVSIQVENEIFEVNSQGKRSTSPVLKMDPVELTLQTNSHLSVTATGVITNPKLWGPVPTQEPNLYTVVTRIIQNRKIIDEYETRFGVRALEFDPEKGVIVNDEHIYLKGANQHHDLGALGAAFNVRAAKRQLEVLREMGCNAIRMAHNPPAPELLDLCDQMGFLVVNEIFDVWERKKTPLDFHLIFPDWWEQDTRSFMRRDRNHPSVIIWSLGNEVGEQYTGEEGAEVARKLQRIAREEDPTRPTAAAINYAKPHMALPPVMDVISLNYQGEGIRNAPEYEHLQGIKTPPNYPDFHVKFPKKVIISSENAAAVSSRGEFIFPVTTSKSSPVSDGVGADPNTMQVSAYELYTTPFGSSPDKVFASLERHPYVAGGFVWSGWDYLGEPTPYYLARSSYFGVIDLAGFKKERFYLYQSHWRPDFPMAQIIPHWNWPDRVGEITPVHVFTSGDEAELFLNGESLGRKQKGEFEYRLRWDEVTYRPGELKVVAYKDGELWAESSVATTDNPSMLFAIADRNQIVADGKDLVFITVQVRDRNDQRVPDAKNRVEFSVEGPGTLVATDNGDPFCMTPFHSPSREAFNGLILGIIKAKRGEEGTIKVTARSAGLTDSILEIKAIR